MTVHVKGIVLRARTEFIRKHFGEDDWRRVLEALKPQWRPLLEGDVLMSSWYPLSILIDLSETADRVLAKGDLALCRTIGRETARLALQGVHRSFAREGDPSFVIRVTPLLWSQYYDSGRSETESTGPSSARTSFHDFAEPHRAICLGILGWLEAANEIWGGRDVRVAEKKCRCWKDDRCEFEMQWTDPSQGHETGSAPGGDGGARRGG